MNEEKDIVIDESNFNEYFFDVKKHGPQKGQIMARYIAKAELMRGQYKECIIDLLMTNPMGAEMSVQIAKNSFAAQEMEAINLCKAITADLVNGKSKDEVLDTPYKYTLEKFFWTKEEYVPKNDPHWQVIKVYICNNEQDLQKNEE